MSKPQKREGIRKRGNMWYVNIMVDGLRKEFAVGTNKQEAVAIRSKMKCAVKAGVSFESFILPDTPILQASASETSEAAPMMTYKAAVDLHEEIHLKNLKSHDDAMDRLKPSVEVFGNRSVDSITTEEIERFRNTRLETHSAGTVVKELGYMQTVLDRPISKGFLTINPVKAVLRPNVSNVRDSIISHADFIKLLSAEQRVNNRGTKLWNGPAHHVVLALIIADYTGMRKGEILKMRWDQIDTELTKIFVPKSNTKTSKGRFVPIHAELQKILQAQSRVSPFVVHENRMPLKDIKKGFNTMRVRSGIGDLHFHDFRHRAITRWVQQGFPPHVIMLASGHVTMSSFSRYINLQESDVMSLVGRTVISLPVVTFDEYREIVANCGKWKKEEVLRRAA